jgi:hypothetical protein
MSMNQDIKITVFHIGDDKVLYAGKVQHLPRKGDMLLHSGVKYSVEEVIWDYDGFLKDSAYISVDDLKN